MRHEVRKLTVSANIGAPTNEVSKSIRDLTNCCVLVDAGPAVGGFSVKIQGKISGPGDTASSTWFDLTGALVGSTLVPLDRVSTTDIGGYSMPFTDVRVVTTTSGSTPPLVTVAGYNERTH